MAIKAQDIYDVQRLLKHREDRVLDLERVENGAIDATIHGTYQGAYMDERTVGEFKTLMVRHAQRRLDDIDESLKRLGFEIERPEDEVGLGP